MSSEVRCSNKVVRIRYVDEGRSMARWWAFIVWVGGVGERQSEDCFFSFYATLHKGIVRELSYETGIQCLRAVNRDDLETVREKQQSDSCRC